MGDARALIDGLVGRLLAGYAPEKVVLFGSYAGGTPGRDSDIDLLVVKDTPARLIDRLIEVHRILSDPERRVPLDVLVLTPREVSERLAAGDQFVKGVLERGKVLYAA